MILNNKKSDARRPKYNDLENNLALVHYVNLGSREPWKSMNQGKM